MPDYPRGQAYYRGICEVNATTAFTKRVRRHEKDAGNKRERIPKISRRCKLHLQEKKLSHGGKNLW